ncbi:unnamed protein product, partial [Rotaria socialis]
TAGKICQGTRPFNGKRFAPGSGQFLSCRPAGIRPRWGAGFIYQSPQRVFEQTGGLRDQGGQLLRHT